MGIVLYCFYKMILKNKRGSKTSQPCLHTYRPMRARVVAQLFYKTRSKNWPILCDEAKTILAKKQRNVQNMHSPRHRVDIADHMHFS